ncbi:MAG: putative maltokinase [Burkholderiaceae bacterium]|nr:putative maltokinase [Burkholderiaceae bacterium]
MDQPFLLAEAVVETAHETTRYFLPLGAVPDDEATPVLSKQLALARIRRNDQIRLLTDAFTIDSFAHRMLALMRTRAVLPAETGELRFLRTDAFDGLDIDAALPVSRPSAEQSNSSLIIGDKAILKVLRRIAGGIHPEAEMGHYLTRRRYANTPAMLGEVIRYGSDGVPYTLILLQRFIDNQGDGWNWVLSTLDRAIRNAAEIDAPTAIAQALTDPMEELLEFSGTLGKRLAEMHGVLALPTDEPDFSPQKVSTADARLWAREASEQLDRMLEVLKEKTDWRNEADEHLGKSLLSLGKRLRDAFMGLAAEAEGLLKIRIHGDFHLGQVLVTQGDVYIVDFEGEPARPLELRRAKHSPLRDVAGLLRSFDYAAAFARQSGPDDVGEAAEERKLRLLKDFESAASSAFLAAYHRTMRAVHPEGAASASAEEKLLDLFCLQKAAYEVCYEAAERPAWIGVPMRGFLAIARRMLNESGGPNDRN